MRGFVDKSACIGCSICTSNCSEVFEMDVDGLARSNDIEITEELEDSLREAVESCPVNAIGIK